jgi:transposase
MLAGKEASMEMGKPYSQDLHKRVVAAIEGGLSRNQAAKQFGVAISTAIGWMQRVDETGSVASGPDGRSQAEGGFGRPRGLAVATDQGRRFHHTRVVAELAARGLKVDYHQVWDFVHAEKLSFKKSVVAGERDRPAVARRRAQWAKYMPSALYTLARSIPSRLAISVALRPSRRSRRTSFGSIVAGRPW